jgi:hypothetical protein
MANPKQNHLLAALSAVELNRLREEGCPASVTKSCAAGPIGYCPAIVERPEARLEFTMLMKNEIGNYQHDERDTHKPTQYIFSHDRRPCYGSNRSPNGTIRRIGRKPTTVRAMAYGDDKLAPPKKQMACRAASH